MFLKEMAIHSETFPDTDAYPFCLEILNRTETLGFDQGITLFCGENGTGKSTVLKAWPSAAGFNIWEPEFQLRCETNHYENLLYRHLSVTWNQGPVPGSYFGSQNFSYFARKLEEWASMTGPCWSISGGNR